MNNHKACRGLTQQRSFFIVLVSQGHITLINDYPLKVIVVYSELYFDLEGLLKFCI